VGDVEILEKFGPAESAQEAETPDALYPVVLGEFMIDWRHNGVSLPMIQPHANSGSRLGVDRPLLTLMKL
jgi:hypothetical protein